MTEAKKTLITLVLDETGSMLERQEATQSAFNEYFKTLKQNSANFVGEVLVNIFQFSKAPPEENVRTFHHGGLDSVPILDENNYRPRGITPLLDAVGTALQQADAEPADRYLFIVQTDGIENASIEFTNERIAQIIQEKEAADNWTIVFLGEGVSGWAQRAQAMGVKLNSVVGTRGATGATTTSYASMGGQSVEYLSSNVPSAKGMASAVQDSVDEFEEKEEPA